MENGMPVFVRIDDYKEVLEVLSLLNERIGKAKETLQKLNDLKNQEDAELELWEKELAEIDNRLALMNKGLVEPRI